MNDYTTFFCEYTFKDGDIHFHFFLTEVQMPNQYWDLAFPQTLDKVARAHFEAEYPRLQASLIKDVLRDGADPDTAPSENSWWLIAQEFEDVPDPNMLVRTFLEKLDQGLESAIRT